jgi:hypothetical protein
MSEDGLMAAAFDRAVERRPDAVRERWLRFAGHPVRVRAVGPELCEHSVRPFAPHLLGDPVDGEPALSIDLWDERATGVGCPLSPASEPQQVVANGTGVVRYLDPRSVTEYDRRRRRIVGWRADELASPTEGMAKPLPFVLPCWYLDRGLWFVHGGLVAREGVGAWIAGASGAGKSTTSLACAAAGLEFMADDQIVLEERADGSFAGHSPWSVAGVPSKHIRRHPELTCGAAKIELDRGKTLLHLGAGSRADVRDRADIRVILIPRQHGNADSRLEAATRAQALLAVAPSSAFGYGTLSARPGFDALERLVRSVPAYWLEAGTDLTGVVDEVERAIAEVA